MRLLTPEEAAARGGRGGLAGTGLAVFQRDCQVCHGADRTGTANGPSLVGIGSRLSAEELRSIVVDGKGRMPPLTHLTQIDVDAVVAYVAAADAGGRGGGGRGRGAAAVTFPPGPVAESGPAVVRVNRGVMVGYGGRVGGPQAYPEGVEAPAALSASTR